MYSAVAQHRDLKLLIYVYYNNIIVLYAGKEQ